MSSNFNNSSDFGSICEAYLSMLQPINESSQTKHACLGKRKTFRGKFSIYFSKVDRKEVRKLLDEIDGYVENRRYDRKQFEKYLDSTKGTELSSNSMFYGMFESEGGKCLALSYLNRTPKDFILIAEIQSIFKGCGKILIENIASLCGNMWLMADPSVKSGLVEYYRQFGFEEKTYKNVKWNKGKDVTFFFKTSDDRHKKILIDFLDGSVVE